MMRNVFSGFALLSFFLISSISFSYTVVLKNGKTVEGTLVEETNGLIVLKDKSGIRINFKKANLDLEKTKAANDKAESTPAPAISAETKPAASESKSDSIKSDPPKKPARVVTEADLEKLRKKYDLGEGLTKGENSIEASESEADWSDVSSEQSENEWKSESRKTENQVRQAENSYNQLKKECDELKSITVQTHILVDQNGQELDMAETAQQVCEDAERAREDLDQARSDRQALEDKAKQEGAPPGWIRTDDEN